MLEITAIEAARVFAKWATAEGFFEGYNESDIGAAEQIENLNDTGRSSLRQRQITQVGADSSTGTVLVFLRRALPAKKILASMPTKVCGFEILYKQGVAESVGNTENQPYGGPAWRIRNSNGDGRYTCGSSISVGNFMDAGTLGALVRDASGTIFGLSNNHVSGSSNHADIGLPIVAPGVFDVVSGGLDPFTLGYHANTLPMAPGSPTVVSPSNNHDAAIFKIKDPSIVTSFQGDSYDTPAVVAQMTAGMLVEKVGRTTGHTKGRVQCQIGGPVYVSYSASNYGFSGRVYFDPCFYIEGDGGIFSDSGDSGSLIVTTQPDGTRAAVGLVFAGAPSTSAPGGKLTLALPIQSVLSRLGLSLVSGHNI